YIDALPANAKGLLPTAYYTFLGICALTTLDSGYIALKWFLGAITDENPRKTAIALDFLPKGQKFKAIIYEDGSDADWQQNPKSYKIRTVTVTSKSKLNLVLAPGGGTAISFEPSN
ncbi:MAG: hypothetical protein EOO48_12895, partial [Flavobacterium sp.]